MITIEFNGESKGIDDDSTIDDLLRIVKVDRKFCAVERNLEIVPKEHYATLTLAEGDRIEVVTLVGGG